MPFLYTNASPHPHNAMTFCRENGFDAEAGTAIHRSFGGTRGEAVQPSVIDRPIPRQRARSRLVLRVNFIGSIYADEPVSIKLHCVYYGSDNILSVAHALAAINRTSSQTAESSKQPSTRSYRPRSHSRILQLIRLNPPKGFGNSSRPQSIGVPLTKQTNGVRSVLRGCRFGSH